MVLIAVCAGMKSGRFTFRPSRLARMSPHGVTIARKQHATGPRIVNSVSLLICLRCWRQDEVAGAGEEATIGRDKGRSLPVDANDHSGPIRQTAIYATLATCYVADSMMNRIAFTLALAVALGTASPDDELLAASQRASQTQDPVMNAIAAATEMPALESIIIPPDHREIRIRSEQPVACCDPRPMLRLVEEAGQVRVSTTCRVEHGCLLVHWTRLRTRSRWSEGERTVQLTSSA